MSKIRKIFVGWRWYRCVSFEVFDLPIGCLKGRGGSFRAMMVMMMMMVMMVMSVGLGTLSPTNWRIPAGAIIVALTVVVLGLPSFSSSSRLHRSIRKHLVAGMLIVTPGGTRVRKLGLHCSWHWAGDTDAANTASYAGEHAAEFTLNPRLTSRALQLRLCALNCLR